MHVFLQTLVPSLLHSTVLTPAEELWRLGLVHQGGSLLKDGTDNLRLLVQLVDNLAGGQAELFSKIDGVAGCLCCKILLFAIPTFSSP